MFKSASSPACLVALISIASAPFLSSASFAANGFACSLPVVSSPTGFGFANPTVIVLNANTGTSGTNESIVVLEENGVLKSVQATKSFVSTGAAKGSTYAFELEGKALTFEVTTPHKPSCGRGSCDLDTPLKAFGPAGVLTGADGAQVNFSCKAI